MSMEEKERKAMIQQTFDTVAEGYDNSAMRFFPASAKHLASLLDLRGDEHILDVATGTGNVALTLAESLPNGHVTGIDFSREMLSQAKNKMEKRCISNIDFTEMDMQSIEFPDNHFDIAVCAFSIFFIDDMQAQLRLMAEKTKPGGKVVITSFTEDTFLPLNEMFLDRIQQYGVEIPPMTWKRIATKNKSESLFKNATLENIECRQKDTGYYLETPDQWWDLLWNAGYRGLIKQLSDDDLKKFKKEHLQEVEKLSTNDGIWLDVNVLYTLGTKG